MNSSPAWRRSTRATPPSKYPRPCTLEQARACLAHNEVALLYVPGQDQSYVLVVQARPAAEDPADGLAIYPLANAGSLEDLVGSLTDTDTLALPARAGLGAEGYQELLGPIHDQIRGKDLVIVPSGALCYCPSSCWWTAKAITWWSTTAFAMPRR